MSGSQAAGCVWGGYAFWQTPCPSIRYFWKFHFGSMPLLAARYSKTGLSASDCFLNTRYLVEYFPRRSLIIYWSLKGSYPPKSFDGNAQISNPSSLYFSCRVAICVKWPLVRPQAEAVFATNTHFLPFSNSPRLTCLKLFPRLSVAGIASSEPEAVRPSIPSQQEYWFRANY